MYILLTNESTVAEVIPDEDPIFPGVPIEDRYTPEFIAELIHVSNDTEVDQNWEYNPDSSVFTAPMNTSIGTE